MARKDQIVAPVPGIEIIAIPESEAPDYVRNAWYLMKLPLSSQSNMQKGEKFGVVSHEAHPLDGTELTVNTSIAISLLREAGKHEAANYWRDLLATEGSQAAYLVFDATCCRQGWFSF